MADNIETIRPGINYQDKLLTEIDILDDVKQLSTQMEQEEKGFVFPKDHYSKIKSLKGLQVKLLKEMQELAEIQQSRHQDETAYRQKLQELEDTTSALRNVL
ncbi:BA75_00484T0 [Komagataella pastoris]|uniref:BA75_00484T0 n=1 Tax=Komagataella pastoris TaxID=4922 RepID=A0A1B2J5N3_PICPA|nr:BA75_00484T0 [Komagataella pastoris]